MKWKDGTSYSRGNEERIPTVLKCEISKLEILVHRIHGLGGWYLTCRYLNIEYQKLDYDELQDCQSQAVEIVRQKLYEKALEIQEIKNILKELEGRKS